MVGTNTKKTVPGPADPMSPKDLRFIQADVVIGMLKRVENFIFFSIKKEARADKGRMFREQLKTLIPDEDDNGPPLRITSAMRAVKFREHVDATKDQGTQPNVGINIAFSAKGLTVLGINPKDMKDDPFAQGQLASAADLGDDVKTQWDPVFKSKADGDKFVFEDGIHGVIIAVASDADRLKEATESITKGTFKTTIDTFVEPGKVRQPDSQRGHEHFGFKDGITQPLLKGLDTKSEDLDDIDDATDDTKKVNRVEPGVFLVRRPGDPVPAKSRPEWTTNGSFMAFRKLEQHVPEFMFDINTMARNMKIDSDLLGARLVGRWKSGAPVQNFATADTSKPSDDQQAILFDIKDTTKCPLAAHIRKMNPRGDVKDPTDVPSRRMLRRGIAYGGEMTKDEISNNQTTEPRGLLFVCYQSSLAKGFEFVQKGWANNQNFPPGKPPPGQNFKPPGVDPLIGMRAGRRVLGADPNPQQADTNQELTRPWVVSKGGEYFFSPSITALGEAPFAA